MYISSDLLLWHALPDGADIVRAFFNTDRTRRILIYRRKDGTFPIQIRHSALTNTNKAITGWEKTTNSVFTTGKKVFCATFPVCWKA